MVRRSDAVGHRLALSPRRLARSPEKGPRFFSEWFWLNGLASLRAEHVAVDPHDAPASAELNRQDNPENRDDHNETGTSMG